ncbi:MAG: hypothetical protein R2764_00040 [Bacteroidales bacterium]
MKFFFAGFLLFITVQMGFAQSIKNVRTTLTENEYGNTILLVEPQTIDPYSAKPTATDAYAILVCYTYKGEKKALHQNITYDLLKYGKKELHLGMSASRENITIDDVYFYRRDLVSESQWPTKSRCY